MYEYTEQPPGTCYLLSDLSDETHWATLYETKEALKNDNCRFTQAEA